MVFSPRRYYRAKKYSLSIPDKANRVLHIVLVGMLLILARVWHLSVIQHEQKVQEAIKPRHRVIIEPAKRGTIRDRFGIPLAINKMQYQASVSYAQLREIPSIVWERNNEGLKIKRFKRREYIKSLSILLAEALRQDPERIEDLIHSKAAFYTHIPLVIKQDISEKEYYRLKILEKDWPGIVMTKAPKRYYPRGRLAGDILGFMGAIDKKKYDQIMNEIKTLENYFQDCESGEDCSLPEKIQNPDHAKMRLQELISRSYSIHDNVGKAGIEGKFEEDLRGFYGKKIYESDARGHFLRKMPGSYPPVAGNQLLLTLSAELQEYAEQLLAQNEQVRRNSLGAHKTPLKAPWISGGAIVAMDPQTGEILAMASYPRYDPNDFIASNNPEISKEKHSHILRWFENENYIGEIWDQKRPLEREHFDRAKGILSEESITLNWENYIQFILPDANPVRLGLEKVKSIAQAIELQNNWSSDSKDKLEQYFQGIPNQNDQLLFMDLCRLVVCSENFSKEVLHYFGNVTLESYRDSQAALVVIFDVLKEMTKEIYHDLYFRQWRQENEKRFLQEKRAEEKEEKRYAKPYLDYLDQIEKKMFQSFWDQYRWDLLHAFLNGSHQSELQDIAPYVQHLSAWHAELSQGAHHAVPWREKYFQLKSSLKGMPSSVVIQYLKTMRSFSELNRPLLGKYRGLRNISGISLEKHLAAAFYPKYGFGYARSYAFRQSTIQGSIFKILIAYEALVQRYKAMAAARKIINEQELNPLVIVEQLHQTNNGLSLGYFEDGSSIPQSYKGGRLIKSLTRNLGKVDLIKAIATSSNPYFSILAGDIIENPTDLARSAELFGYGRRTGIDLPGEIAGNIPSDLEKNRSGLYSCAIGQHSLVVTPLQTAVMLSAVANGGKILKPQIVKAKTSTASAIIKDQVFLPKEVHNILLKGMQQVVSHIYDVGLKRMSRTYYEFPLAVDDFLLLKDQMVGKTSSAECMEQINLDREEGVQKSTHIGFGAISFKEPLYLVSRDIMGQPELIVVVYLKHGGLGTDASPVAAQIIKKWRDIKKMQKEM